MIIDVYVHPSLRYIYRWLPSIMLGRLPLHNLFGVWWLRPRWHNQRCTPIGRLFHSHRNPCIVMMPTLPSLVAPEVVLTTTSGATSDDKVSIKTVVGFNDLYWYFLELRSMRFYAQDCHRGIVSVASLCRNHVGNDYGIMALGHFDGTFNYTVNTYCPSLCITNITK